MLTKVAKRLPHQWLSGWQAEVDSLIHLKGQEVSIENLAAYVTLKTRQITNLDCNWAQTNKRPDLHRSRKETALATQTILSPPKLCCKLCKGSHYLNQCKRFRKYVYEDRIKFVTESKLCRSCLDPGHFAKNCSRKSPCKRPDCNGFHTTLLHPPEKCTFSSSATNQMDSPADSALSHIAVHNGLVGVPTRPRSSLPIVAVRICTSNSEQSIVTQAFLDTGSTSSFITNDLIEKLRIRRSPVVKVITVTINHGTDTRKAKVISDLELSDLLESSPYSHLQPLPSIQRLPATTDDAPSQEDISEFPEFADISIPRVNSNVGLLIGNDNRHIMKPHEIISSESDHYAIRTAIGWVVNCSKKGSSTKSCKSCVLSRLRCNGHSLLLDSYLSRNGKIENSSCSACGHSSQDVSHFILHCPATDSLLRSLFGESLYDLWSRPWRVSRLLGLHGLPPCPHPSEGVG